MSGFDRSPRVSRTIFFFVTTCVAAILFGSAASAKSERNIIPMPRASTDYSNTTFCQQVRKDRIEAIESELVLDGMEAVSGDDTVLCFTPAENLYFIANQEAEKQLPPLAPWYAELSLEMKKRVDVFCTTQHQDEEVEQCRQQRFDEIMEPYQDLYHDEAYDYLKQRHTLADRLVERCSHSLRVKRSQLPIDARFPIAYYNRRISTLPNWYLEERANDPQWITGFAGMGIDELMQELLDDDCPGNMVFWVTYDLADK